MNYWRIFTVPTTRARHLRTLFALGLLVVVCAVHESFTEASTILGGVIALSGALICWGSMKAIHKEFLAHEARERKRKKSRAKERTARTLKNPRETRLNISQRELSETRKERESYYHLGRAISLGELARMDQLAAHEKAIQSKIERTKSPTFGKPRNRPKRS